MRRLLLLAAAAVVTFLVTAELFGAAWSGWARVSRIDITTGEITFAAER